MRPFSRKCKRSIFILRKAYAAGNQVTDHILRGTDHNIHGNRIVLIMPGPHGVLIIRLVVGLIAQHADASLRKKRITAFKICLGNQKDFFILRDLKGKIQGGTAAADDQYICFHHLLLPFAARAARINTQPHQKPPYPCVRGAANNISFTAKGRKLKNFLQITISYPHTKGFLKRNNE